MINLIHTKESYRTERDEALVINDDLVTQNITHLWLYILRLKRKSRFLIPMVKTTVAVTGLFSILALAGLALRRKLNS